MEELKKQALQVADDLAKMGAVCTVTKNIKVDIKRYKDFKNRFVLIITDLNDNLIFEYYTSLVR